MFNRLSWLKRQKWSLTANATLAALLLLMVGVQVADRGDIPEGQPILFGVGDQKVITLGYTSSVYAAGAVDYTLDGVDDDVQFQAALDALPVTGGRLVVVSAVQINFSATVSRAIDDVVIQGSGVGTSFVNDGVTPIFSAGVQSGWVFRDFSTDAGGITYLTSSAYILENVTLGGVYHAYRTDASADEWAIPSGRTATFTVAASNASASSLAQADYVCSGANDNVEIQAAIDALPASGGNVELSEGDFVLAAQLLRAIDDVTISGQGNSTYLALDGSTAIVDVGTQDGWLISSISADAGSFDLTSATNSTIFSCWVSDQRVSTNHYTGAYSRVLTVAAVGGDFTSLSDVRAYFDGLPAGDKPAASRKFLVEVYGVVTGAAYIQPYPNVDVTGYNADITVTGNSVGYGAVTVQNNHSFTWSNLTIRGNQSTGVYHYVVDVSGTGTNIEFHNCTFISENIATTNPVVSVRGSSSPKFFDCTFIGHSGNVGGNRGVTISGTAHPTFTGCKSYAGTGIGALKSGWEISGQAYPTLIDCIGYGSPNGTDTARGIYIANDMATVQPRIIGGYFYGGSGNRGHGILDGRSSAAWVTGATGVGGSGANTAGIVHEDAACGTWNSCTSIGGSGSDATPHAGLEFAGVSAPIVNGGITHGGENAMEGYAVYISGMASPIVNGLLATPLRHDYWWYYDDADNGRFQPFASKPYMVVIILVAVVNANIGVTMDLGTSIGGNEIANNVDIGAIGAKYGAFYTLPEVVADGYMYATPSAGITDGDVIIMYAVTTNYATSYGIYHYGYGDRSRFNNSTFQSNGASSAAYITNTTPLLWKFNNCVFETSDVVNEYAVNYGVPTLAVPLYNCSYVGGLNNVTTLAPDGLEVAITANAFQYPAPGTDWTSQLEGANLGANLGAKKCWLPLNFLQEGDEIISYNIVGDAVEAATLTLDCKLVRINKANPLTTTDVAGGGIIQVDADGNFDVLATLTDPEVVATDKQYALEILGTTGAGDAITVIGAEVVIKKAG